MSWQIATFALFLSSVQPTEGDQAALLWPERKPVELEAVIDPITDTVSAFAVAHSREGRLDIGCDPDKFDGLRVSFTSKNWFKGTNILRRSQSITYRFDSSPARLSEWRVKNDTAHLRRHYAVPAFLAQMRDAERLVIRFKDIESRETDVWFWLRGSKRAIDLMHSLCRAPYTYAVPTRR